VCRPASDLGGPKNEPTAALFGQLPRDPHGGRLDIDVGAPQSCRLAPSQTAENGEQHQGAVSVIDGIGQGVDLGNRQTGRSGECSCPAPWIRHGLRRISPSSTAVLKTALSSRYALAAVTALTSASRSPHAGPQPQGDIDQYRSMPRAPELPVAVVLGACRPAHGYRVNAVHPPGSIPTRRRVPGPSARRQPGRRGPSPGPRRPLAGPRMRRWSGRHRSGPG
jgi:hypothetical protein